MTLGATFHRRIRGMGWGAFLGGTFLIMGCEGSASVPSLEATTPTEALPETLPEVFPTPPGKMELPPGLGPGEENASVDSQGMGESHPTSEPSHGSGFDLPTDDAGDTSKAMATDSSTDFPATDSLPGKTKIASWKEILSIAQAPGRITVVDLWSLSCEPCMKEFPGLVRLHHEMPQQVRCLAVNLDFDGRKKRPPTHYESKVRAFLKSVDAADLPSYICSTANDEVYSEAKIQSLPAVLVFDQQGDLVQVFVDAGETSGFTYENDVIPAVMKQCSP